MILIKIFTQDEVSNEPKNEFNQIELKSNLLFLGPFFIQVDIIFNFSKLNW
jgi:hypothetical protein